MSVILNFKIGIKFYRSIDQNQSNLTISHHEIAKANDYYRKQVPYSTKNPSREHSKGANRVCISSTFSGLLRPILSMNQYCLSEYQEALCQS